MADTWSAGGGYEPYIGRWSRAVATGWTPFLSGQGPAPSYVASLDDPDRGALREALRSRLTVEAGGSIALTARAWAARGSVPR